MESKTDKINAYIDLISSSLDTDTLKHPDFKYIVHKISRENFEDAKRRCLLRIQNHDDEALSWALYGLTLMLQAEVKKAGEALLKAATSPPESCNNRAK